MQDKYITSDGITYAAHRGAPGQGYFVVASSPAPNRTRRVVAGPYTNEAAALERAGELAADHERELRPAGLITRGLDELAARRVAAALGVELGPLTDAELAATAELERTAAELGLEVPA